MENKSKSNSFFPEQLQQVRDGMMLPTWAIEIVEWSVLVTVILFIFSKSLFKKVK